MARSKIGVLFGGRSVEHDVSVITGHQAMAALEPNHDVVPIYVTRQGAWLTAPDLNDLKVYRAKTWDRVGSPCHFPPGQRSLVVKGSSGGGLLKKGSSETTERLDAVVIALHGTFGEDGTVQGLLELADIPYTGPGVVGSAVGMDKPLMKAAFKAAGLPVLDHVLIRSTDIERDLERVVTQVEEGVGYPAFAKPASLGSSVGIGKAKDRDSLKQALEVARAYDSRVMVERSAEGCIEINCSVLGGHGFEPRASVCEQPVPWEEFLSFSDKYMRGGKRGSKGAVGMDSQERRIPAPISDQLTKQIQDYAVEAFKAIEGAGVARIDFFLKEDTSEVWINEINTIPGSFAFYLWEHSGINFEGLMQSLIDIAAAGHAAKEATMFTFESGMLDRTLGGSKSG